MIGCAEFDGLAVDEVEFAEVEDAVFADEDADVGVGDGGGCGVGGIGREVPVPDGVSEDDAFAERGGLDETAGGAVGEDGLAVEDERKDGAGA